MLCFVTFLFLTVGVTSDRRHFLLHSHLPIRATAQRRPFSLCPAKITKVAVLEGSTVLTPFTQPVNLDCQGQLNLLFFLIKTNNLFLTSKNLVKFSYWKGKVSSSSFFLPVTVCKVYMFVILFCIPPFSLPSTNSLFFPRGLMVVLRLSFSESSRNPVDRTLL